MNFERTNTKIPLLDDYYEHFNEDDRLKTRHGNVEYVTHMKYIHEVLNNDFNKTILDIGAATGAYSIPLHKEGYKVCAVELVKHNLDILIKKEPTVECYLGNALELSFLKERTFDVILLFGPMYHLLTEEEKIKCLLEAKKHLSKNGVILVSYYMNEYAVITYGFIKQHILESIQDGSLDENYHVISKDGDLYSMVNLTDIDRLNQNCNLKRIKIVSSDGPSDYLRVILNKLSAIEYDEFIKYHLSTCERMDLIGASAHTLDIIKA